METLLRPARSRSNWPALLIFATVGCASPGVPRPPSLNLPQPVRDLTANRIGDTVQLHFTVPSRSTDKLPLRGTTLSATFCRELDHQLCQPISASSTTIPVTTREDAFTWTETLPPDLTRGEPHTLGYRVAFSNIAGRSAGNSAPAFTATGPAPAPVKALHAEGSRLGIVLRWAPAAPDGGSIILQREDLAPAPPTPGPHSKPATPTSAIVDLIAPPGTPTNTLLDASAQHDTPYRYTAMRGLTVQLGGRALELRSAPSLAPTITLRQIYPPLTPTGLTAAPFTATEAAFAVDLVWQPVDEPGLIVPLAGYNLYREPLIAPNTRTRLNPSPLQLPAFHDITAAPNTPYRYSVTAVDTKGNESPAATLILQP
jgi:hypothetical protein